MKLFLNVFLNKKTLDFTLENIGLYKWGMMTIKQINSPYCYILQKIIFPRK